MINMKIESLSIFGKQNIEWVTYRVALIAHIIAHHKILWRCLN